MKTIDVLPVGEGYAFVMQMPALLGVSLRTTSRYISFAVASELSAFAGYEKGNPLNLAQQKALKIIREGKRLGRPEYAIAEAVEALSQPAQLSLDVVADWLRRRVPEKYAEDFVTKLYEDFQGEDTEISQ